MDDEVVGMFVTTESPVVVKKVVQQLEDLGVCRDVCAFTKEHKVVFSVRVRDVSHVCRVYNVERAFVLLFCRVVDADSPLMRGEALQELAGWVHASPWASVLHAWEQAHARRPKTWSVDSKRRCLPTSPLHALDKLGLQQCVRDALHKTLQPHHMHHDPKRPDLMVFLNVTPALAIAGVPLYQRRVKKGYLPHKGLHHSLCWGMAATARINAGETVLDPMCGSAAILVEAHQFFPRAHFVGCDVSEAQLRKAVENALNSGSPLCLWHGDATRLPVRDGAVDVVLCDLPFGRQHGSVESNEGLYLSFLKELGRVLHPTNGRAVLLTGHQSKHAMDRALGVAAALRLVACTSLQFGGNHDKHACFLYLVCPAHRPPGNDKTVFDTSFHPTHQGSSWKCCKPVLVPYQPRKSLA